MNKNPFLSLTVWENIYNCHACNKNFCCTGAKHRYGPITDSLPNQLAQRSLCYIFSFCLTAQWNICFSARFSFAIVLLQPFNPASQTYSVNQLSVIRVQQIQLWICILLSHHSTLLVHQKKFSSNYTSKSEIITTLYIICIFQLIFKSCIGFCMQIYNIFRIRYITIKSLSSVYLASP